MTRFALVLGGGVSLGTYIAGAVTEILLALERNRRGPCTVDVIAGASAGALTAAIAARALAVNRNLLPWLRWTWVEAADIRHLLNERRPDRSGFLDGSVLEEVSRALVTADPASDDEPSPAAGSPLRVSIALANLGGVRFDLPYGFLNVPDRSYGTRIHRDWEEFQVHAGSDPLDPAWERLRRAALASASFPLAFPPRAVPRRRRDFRGARLPAPAHGADPDAITMWYADGGLFHNEPLGLAKRLVERWPDHRRADWRYILVDPYMETDDEDGAAALEPPTSPGRTAALVSRAVLGQSAALDWIRANKVNARLEILEELVARLPELSGRLLDPREVGVGREVGELAERVAEMKVAVRRGEPEDGGDPVVTYLEENVERILRDPRYAPALGRVETRAGRTRLAKLVFILESAGGLRDKEPMPLYLVAPPAPGALAGDFMGNFGGFFHREWREDDLRAGRRDARRLLERHLADVVSYDPDADEEYEVRGVEPSLDDLPPEGRRALERFVRAELDRTIDGLRVPPPRSLFRWLLRRLFRGPAQREMLAALRRVD